MEKHKFKYLIAQEMMFNKIIWIVVTKRKYDSFNGNKRIETINPEIKRNGK